MISTGGSLQVVYISNSRGPEVEPWGMPRYNGAVVSVITFYLRLFMSVQVVDELLSLSESLETKTAKCIADAAMLEVASISMGHMVRTLNHEKCDLYC